MESQPVLVGQTAEISCNFQLGENEYLNTIAWTKDGDWLHTWSFKKSLSNTMVSGFHLSEPIPHYDTEYSQKLILQDVQIADESDTYKCEVATHDGNRGNMTVME